MFARSFNNIVWEFHFCLRRKIKHQMGKINTKMASDFIAFGTHKKSTEQRMLAFFIAWNPAFTNNAFVFYPFFEKKQCLRFRDLHPGNGEAWNKHSKHLDRKFLQKQ